MLTISMAMAISMCSVGHIEKFTSVFGGHHIFMNIPPRKEDGSCAYSFKRGMEIMHTYS